MLVSVSQSERAAEAVGGDFSRCAHPGAVTNPE